MTLLRGAGVGRGAAVGPVARAHPVPVVPDRLAVPTDVEGAVASVGTAFDDVAAVLHARAEAAGGTVGEVLEAAAFMAEDDELRDTATARVRAGAHPARAVVEASAEFEELFRSADALLAERVTDLRSVRDRVVARLLALPEPGVPALTRPSVVVADDLSPADTAAMNLDLVLAIVIAEGGPTSHTAIIAAQLGIPCVVRAAGAAALEDGTQVAVDAAAGTVDTAPDDAVVARVAERRGALAALARDDSPGRTADGVPVALLANIGTAQDAEALPPCEGVGLFRTEVLYLGRQAAPSEAEQIDAYARALRALGTRKVVVRTLDAGADKPLAFITRPGEENPALGVRGFRLARSDAELTHTQLRALAAAGAREGVEPWVMAPMIATPAEAAQFAAMAREAGIARVGVMVEVPAAALRAAEVLAEVDFVSIGTNDLAQYTMATDRLRSELADLLDPWQPAVLDLVAATARAGLLVGKPVGVCGESAADPAMALVLAGLGVTSLSMAPSALGAVRFSLQHHDRATCRQMADVARAAGSADEAREAVLALVDPVVRETLALGVHSPQPVSGVAS